MKGYLVELRPLARSDFDVLYDAAKDPLIWEQHPESDRYTLELFQRYFERGIESGGAFVVIERATGRIIGCTRYCNLKAAESEIEIGWTFLERAFWGGSYNREMKTLMLDHAFRFVDRIVFVIAESNLRSRKATEKIGGKFLRRTESEPGRPPVPFVTYAITRFQYAPALRS